MTSTITSLADRQPSLTASAQLFENWFDPIETAVRDRVHGFLQAMIEAELDEARSRTRYVRHAKACLGSRSETPDGETAAGDTLLRGHRHGHRFRSLMGTFGEALISVPRARIEAPDGKTTEWRSKVLPTYQRRTKAADALIAGAYLAGTNTRRIRRALAALFGGAVSKDTVSRVWRKVKTDWESWNARSLTDEPIVRLIPRLREGRLWTEPWCACASIGRPRRFASSSCWVSARTARKCCWP